MSVRLASRDSRTELRRANFEDLKRLVPGSFAAKLMGGAATFLLNIVLARSVGADGLGVYQLAASITLITSMIARLGCDTAAIKMAATSSTVSSAVFTALYRKTLRITAWASLVASAFIIAVAPWIARYGFSAGPSLTQALRLMALSIFPLALANVLVGFLRGTKRAVGASAVESLIVPAVTLIGVAVVVPRQGLMGAVCVNVLASIVALWVGRRLWKNAYIPSTQAATVKARQVLSTSIPLLWVTAMNLVMQFADVLMVGMFVGDAEVGIYAAALRTATLTNAFLSAMTGVVAPQFASSWASGNHQELERLAQQSTRMMILASLPVVVLLLVMPEWVLSLFGQGFGSGVVALRAVAIGQFLQAAMGAVGYLLAMTGHERDLRNIMLGTAVVFIGLNALLIPTFGISGAGISYALTLLAMNILKSVAVYKRIGIVALPLPVWRRMKVQG